MATSGAVDPSGMLKSWVIGFHFSITAHSTSALALLWLWQLLQISLLLIHCYPDYFKKNKITYM